MKTRIRDIRKRKGLTLEDVAQRVTPPTTAQTIGRLETGDRKLTLDWLTRIAAALDCAPGELTDLGSQTVAFSGTLTRSGRVSPAGGEMVSLHLPGKHPVALKIAVKMADLDVGDTLICDESSSAGFQDCIGKDCLVTTSDGEQAYGRLLPGSAPDRFTVILGGEDSGVLYDVTLKSAARRLMLIRHY